MTTKFDYFSIRHGDRFIDHEGRLWCCFGSNIPQWGEGPRYHFGHVGSDGSVLTWNTRSKEAFEAMFPEKR